MGAVTETSAELSEFVEQMGKAVAEAKRQIDIASIESLQQLSEVNVLMPITTKSINNGKVSYEIKNVTVSPLSLGVMPTFYEFQKTEIEVSMDFEIEENKTQTKDSRNRGSFSKIGKIGVNTKRIRQERKIKTDLKGFSSLKIEMVPVPSPSNMPELIVDNTLKNDT